MIKLRLHYNVLGTAQLALGTVPFFSARHGTALHVYTYLFAVRPTYLVVLGTGAEPVLFTLSKFAVLCRLFLLCNFRVDIYIYIYLRNRKSPPMFIWSDANTRESLGEFKSLFEAEVLSKFD